MGPAKLLLDKRRSMQESTTQHLVMTINKVCGSGMKAVTLAADGIALGRNQISVAGVRRT